MVSDYSKDMYRQMTELYDQVATLTDSLKALKKEVAAKNLRIAELERSVKKLDEKDARIEELEQTIDKLEKKNEVLTQENVLLREEVSRLKSDRNNDSNNSSNPPSSDQKGIKKANEYNSRKKTGKQHGGQPGHKGTTLTKKTAEELIATGKCKHTVKVCGNPATGKYTTKYEIDINIETEITEYRIYEGAFPENAPCGDVYYGPKIKALVVELFGVGVVSIKRIQEIISGITNNTLNIATGTLYGFCRKFTALAQNELKKIEEQLMNSTVVYTDATAVTVNGKLAQIRNISNNNAVRYYAMETKSIMSLKKIDLLAKFAGIFIHDHETALYHFGIGHGECNAHIIRYLLKNTEDSSNSWSGKLTEFLLEMKDAREKAVENGMEAFEPDVLQSYLQRYEDILSLGCVENKNTSPKWARQDEKALLNRLRKYKDNHLLFLYNFDVAFSNNMSERDLRKCKNRQKLAGGFRNTDGCTMFADILSIIETAKRRNNNPFFVIRSLLCSPHPFLYT